MTTTEGFAGGADPYSWLGLAPGASLADVKRAYRRLAMRVHPDHAGSRSLQSFLAIKAAYDWIVAHRSFVEPGERRPDSVRRTTVARRVRRAPPREARAAPEPAVRGTWLGGRWYWEGLRARASRRAAEAA
jgi:hypothetical protein